MEDWKQRQGGSYVNRGSHKKNVKPHGGRKPDANAKQAQRNRSTTGSNRGRMMENRVHELCLDLVERGHLAWARQTEPRSSDDHKGRDEIVAKIVDGEETVRSFGFSLSKGRAAHSRVMHPDTVDAVFHWPWNTKDETIQQRILDLFESESD